MMTHLGGISRDDLLLWLDLQRTSRWFHDRVRGVGLMPFFRRQLEELACGVGVLCQWARDEACGGEARGSLVDRVDDSIRKEDKHVAMAVALSARRHAHVTGHMGVSRSHAPI